MLYQSKQKLYLQNGKLYQVENIQRGLILSLKAHCQPLCIAPENRVPWLFPDLEKFSFFPDHSDLIKLISARKFLYIWLEWFAHGQGISRHIFEKCQIRTPCPASSPPPTAFTLIANVVPFQLLRGRDIWSHMVHFCLGLTIIRILINFDLHIIRT